MKTIKITISAIILLLISTNLLAQKEEEKIVKEYKNQFFFVPTSLITKTIQFGYERQVSKNNSVMLQLGMYSNNESVLDDQSVSGSGFKGELNFNIFSKDLIKGNNGSFKFYCSPYVNYFNSNFTIGKDYYNKNYTTSYEYDEYYYSTEIQLDSITEDGSGTLSHMGLGATIGIRWTISKVLVFDFYHGGGAQLANYTGDDKFKSPIKDETFFNFANTGVVGKVGFRVGLLF